MNAYSVSGAQTSDKERRAIRRYFTPFPKWTVVSTSLAITATAAIAYIDRSNLEDEIDALDDAGIAAADVLPIALSATLVLFAIVVLRLAVWASRPSPEQVDRWLDRDLRDLEQRAFLRCGLDPGERTSPTVTLTGPRFGVHDVDFRFRVERRGIARYTPVGVTILNFTKHQIVVYQCVLDRLTSSALFETTDEYFYQDVVSLSTRNESLTLDKGSLTRYGRRALRAQIRGGKLHIQTAEVFELTTSGGTSVEVIISALLDRLNRAVMGPGGRVRVNDAGQAVAGMRKMLREKKIPVEKSDSDIDDLC